MIHGQQNVKFVQVCLQVRWSKEAFMVNRSDRILWTSVSRICVCVCVYRVRFSLCHIYASLYHVRLSLYHVRLSLCHVYVSLYHECIYLCHVHVSLCHCFFLSSICLPYSFFWVIHRRLQYKCQRFGTLCVFHLHIYPPMTMGQSGPKVGI
jgi:hypothetical protein